MGVHYVLEGSVQRAGPRVRINVQLVDALTGDHVWAERYDRPFSDILALQDDIVQKIVTTLKLQLILWEQGLLVRERTDNLEAYDYYLRGVSYFSRYTKESNAQARQMFEKAIELDPQYAEAYAYLGYTYWAEWVFGLSAGTQTLERALALAQQAVALDDSRPEAHSLLSSIHAQKQQYDHALAEMERAIALDPNNADSYVAQAEVLNFAGRPEDALQMMEQAMRLNPHYPTWYLIESGWAYHLMGRYDEAIAVLKTVLLHNPNMPSAYPLQVFNYLDQWAFQLSDNPQALNQAFEAAQRAIALNNDSPMAHIVLGYVYLVQKQYDPALAEIERAVALDSTLADGYAALALVLSHIGRPEEALRAAEQALRLNPNGVNKYLYVIGTAYDVAGRPEAALIPLQRSVGRYPNFLGAHLELAAVYSELGREAEAQAEAAEVRRLNPHFSLEVDRQRAPIKDPVTLERLLTALRQAGLK